jgi:hypothetical protein
MLTLMTLFLVLQNDYSQSEALASDLAMNLQEVAAVGSGAAVVGGAALGIVIPVLVCVAVAYAGYEIYQNKETIWGAFKNWYEGASSAVETWCNDIAEKIDNGDITDGDSIIIPESILEASKAWAADYAVTYGLDDMHQITGSTVQMSNVYELASSSNQIILDNHPTATLNTYAPVIRLNNLTTGIQNFIYGSNTDHLSTDKMDDTLIINFIDHTTYKTMDIMTGTWSSILAGTQAHTGTRNTFYALGYSWNQTTSKLLNNFQGINVKNVIFNGNTMTAIDSQYSELYEWTFIVPKMSGVVVTNNLGYSPTALLNSSNMTTLVEPDQVFVGNPVQVTDRIYIPTYGITDIVTGNRGVTIPLTPEVVSSLEGYLVHDTTADIELISTLDPTGAGVIDDTPGWLDGLLDGLMNGLKELFEWLFVPSSVAVDEFITHCKNTMEEQAGILTYPLTLVIQFLMAVMTLDVTDCVLHIPRMEVFGYEIYGGLNYNITQELKQSTYSQMYSIYLLITDFIMIIAFLDLAIKKGDEIIRGN